MRIAGFPRRRQVRHVGCVLGVQIVGVSDGSPAYDVRAQRRRRHTAVSFVKDASVPREDHLARAEHPIQVAARGGGCLG